RLERASLSPQGTRRSADSGSSIGARMAQKCVGQPCSPTNVVGKGGPVRNLPYRDQRRRCANPSTIRHPTANSLNRRPPWPAPLIARFAKWQRHLAYIQTFGGSSPSASTTRL